MIFLTTPTIKRLLTNGIHAYIFDEYDYYLSYKLLFSKIYVKLRINSRIFFDKEKSKISFYILYIKIKSKKQLILKLVNKKFSLLCAIQDVAPKQFSEFILFRSWHYPNKLHSMFTYKHCPSSHFLYFFAICFNVNEYSFAKTTYIQDQIF